MNPYHDARGRFARANSFRMAAAANRGGAPTSNTGLRNRLNRINRTTTPNSKAFTASRILSLPVSKKAGVKEKFLTNGNTATVQAKVERKLGARMSVLNAQARDRSSGRSSPASAASRPLTRAERRLTPEHLSAAASRLARARASREERRVAAETAARAARMERRTSIYNQATRGLNKPASTTGQRNLINRLPIRSEQSAIRQKTNAAQRIHQIRNPQTRSDLLTKFVTKGAANNSTFKSRLLRAEAQNQRDIGASMRQARRGQAAAATAPQGTRSRTKVKIEPRGILHEGPHSALAARLAGRAAANQRLRTASQLGAGSIPQKHYLPGTSAGNTATRGATKAQLKDRMVGRLAGIPASKRGLVLATIAREGITKNAANVMRRQEAARAQHLTKGERKRAAAAEAERVRQANLTAAQRLKPLTDANPKLKKAVDDLSAHPTLKALISKIDSSNAVKIADLFEKVPPAEFHRLVTAGLPRGAITHFSLNGNVIQWNARGGGISSIERYMDLGSKKVNHAYFQVEASAQGQMMGRNLFKNLFQLYDKAGIQKVDVHANIDVGGYAWARYGFKPNASSSASMARWIDTYTQTGRPTNARGAVRDQVAVLTASQKAVLASARKDLAAGKGEGIWKLTDHSEPLKNAQGQILKDNNGQPMTLGKAVLLGTDWYGTVHLDNAVNKQRTHSYVGLS